MTLPLQETSSCSAWTTSAFRLPMSARTKAFYEAILMPLGWTCSGWRADVYVGFKKRGSPALYFGASARTAQVHLAFKADSEEKVRRVPSRCT